MKIVSCCVIVQDLAAFTRFGAKGRWADYPDETIEMEEMKVVAGVVEEVVTSLEEEEVVTSLEEGEVATALILTIRGQTSHTLSSYYQGAT